MVQPLCVEFPYLPLQISLSLFQHRAMPCVPALLKLLNHSLKCQAETFFLAEPVGLFPRQTRFFGGGFSTVSSCCASTDLLSHPRAMG